MPDVDWLRDFCMSFPDVKEDMPWHDSLCFKVRGRIFAGVALSDGRFPRVTLKSSPEQFHELLEIDGIVPAPYVGRYKWIEIAKSDLLPAHELESLIRESYELVVARAPKPQATRTTIRRPATQKSKNRATHAAPKKRPKTIAESRRPPRSPR